MVKVKRFTATWCQPCKILAPLFEQLKTEYNNVSFETIDVDTNKEQTVNYGITSVPTVVIEKDGEIIQRFVGVKPKSDYTKIINSLI